VAFAFEKLLVYQKAVDFADAICARTEQFTRGSVQECVPLLELAKRRKLLDEKNHSELKVQLEEIARMLSGLINGLESRDE
jgi:hypothetical protein